MKSFIRYNQIIFLLLGLLITACSCKDNPEATTETNKIYSKNQQYLFDLLDEYKSAYFAAKRIDLRDTIQRQYSEKLRYFLVDSLRQYIDSMNVTVDTVMQEGWLVTTQFHSRNIEFKYGMKFKDNMDRGHDSLYKWMLSLKPKSNLTLNFVLLGSAQLNYPDDSTKSIARIFALPEPLSERPK